MRVLSRQLVSAVSAVGLALASCACGGDPVSASNAVSIRITDTPFADARAVLITFSEVSAHRSSDDGFQRLPFVSATATRTCDLKKLVGAQDVLGVGVLQPGHYTQIRLTVSAAEVFFDNPTTGPACADTLVAPAGRSANVEIPSGEARLNFDFDVAVNAPLALTLDFDGERSIHDLGNGRYMMAPVLSVLNMQ
jgi:hypothetical protein